MPGRRNPIDDELKKADRLYRGYGDLEALARFWRWRDRAGSPPWDGFWRPTAELVFGVLRHPPTWDATEQTFPLIAMHDGTDVNDPAPVGEDGIQRRLHSAGAGVIARVADVSAFLCSTAPFGWNEWLLRQAHWRRDTIHTFVAVRLPELPETPAHTNRFAYALLVLLVNKHGPGARPFVLCDVLQDANSHPHSRTLSELGATARTLRREFRGHVLWVLDENFAPQRHGLITNRWPAWRDRPTS